MNLSTFYAANRGGGLGTVLVSQRIGAVTALAAYRARLSPTMMSMANLVLGLGASAMVLLAAPSRTAPMAVGLGALLLWHVAYGIDCGDGQLARVTKTGSAAGARIDVLCDVALQIALCAATSAVAAEYSPDAPAWIYALFAGTWMVNLVTSVMAQDDAGVSMVTSQSLPVRLVKLIRDYAFVVTVIGLVLAFAPQWTIWVVVAFTAVNGLFLLASIAFTARAAQRAWREKIG
ncbi:CDP-alcohol phosphatidyltransferase family protein [Longispora albida]|uniref:CDP-alcohol phosphatidyltransferase family protein n=1 Tax=Longispora albida TaxID=203523 RepID=UPI000362DB4E|nr:CDP-alcohol phosphatidyltransferase family protein [Longispora albida]